MKTIKIVLSSGIAMLSAVGMAQKTPNVIIVLADDLGYNDPSCYGNKDYTTPNIDRMATEGMRFTQGYTPAAVSTPARYGLLTGRYPWRTFLKYGVVSTSPSMIEKDRYTIGKLFQEYGYRTACIGKWHLGFNEEKEGKGNARFLDFNKPITVGPNQLGFDYSFILPVGHFAPPIIYIENDRILGYDPNDPFYVKKGGIWDQNVEGGKEALAMVKQEYVNKELFAKTEAFIKKCKDAGKPFFVYLPATVPHVPYHAHPDFQNSGPQGIYGDAIRDLDDSMGKLMDRLKEWGLEENTMIIFTSDNGGVPQRIFDLHYPDAGILHNTTYPLHGNKGDAWEGGTRIPFIVKYPASGSVGKTCDEPVCFTDFLASFASMFGKVLPDNAGEDSFNVMNTLLYGTKLPDRPFVLQGRGGYHALRWGDWKFIDDWRGGDNDPETRAKKNNVPGPKTIPGELFDMKNDFTETKNLYTTHPEKVKEMTDVLNRIRETTNRQVWKELGIKAN